MPRQTTETAHAEIVPADTMAAGRALLIADDIGECNKLHQLATATAAKARQEAERACQLAVVLGIRLKTLKELTPHGTWATLFPDPGQIGHSDRFEPAAAQNGHSDRFEFAIETARRYIRAAEGALARPGLPAKARKELLHLADPNADITPAHWDHLARATAGQTLRQLYLDLGIVRASADQQGGHGGYKPRTDPPPPPPPECELVWEEICPALTVIDDYVNRHGRIAALDAARLDHAQAILDQAAHTLRRINRA